MRSRHFPFLLSLPLLTVLMLSCSNNGYEPFADHAPPARGEFDFGSVFELAAAHAANAVEAASGHDRFPHSVHDDGTTKYAQWRDWTSGFFPGILWLLYDSTGEEAWRTEADRWTAALERAQYLRSTHDLGFMIYCSYGNGYRLTGDDAYRDVIVQSAESLMTRFNPDVGAIRSWDSRYGRWSFRQSPSFTVIIDNMMNLEILFFASRATGDPAFAEVATTHAHTTLRDFMREDGSSYHVIHYDSGTGDIRRRRTHQGFAESSSWARGQAWGLYGFTVVWRETNDPVFLELAVKIADYITSHPAIPGDRIPYWDYDDPAIPDAPRDASAAAITASALLELQKHAADRGAAYREYAESILTSLASPAYTAPPGSNNHFILKHSTGNLPHGVEIDKPLIYADYYYLEGMLRYMRLDDE